MLLLPFILHIGRTSASYDDVFSSGIIFHKESKNLLTEKFVNVVPYSFPKVQFHDEDSNEELPQQIIGEMANTLHRVPSRFFHELQFND